MTSRLNIVDCTLREGDQTAGVAMTLAEKLEIAEALDAAGVAMADAGMPAVHESEASFLRQASRNAQNMIVGASIRCRPDMARMALDCGVGAVFVICPISSQHLSARLGVTAEQLFDSLAEVADVVSGHATLEVVAEDATRAQEADLLALATAARKLKADRFYLADTVGSHSPGRWTQLVQKMLAVLGSEVDLGVHCHNDFGMATALTVAAIEAGVRWPTATVNGLGERAGNADLGSVAAACSHLLGMDGGLDLQMLPELSNMVQRASGVQVAPSHPLVGANAFRHESGIHVHGVLADPSMYEFVAPESVGRERTLLLGKHSGRSHLHAVLSEYDIELSKNEVEYLRKKIQDSTMSHDRNDFDSVLRVCAEHRQATQGVAVEQVLVWARQLSEGS